MYYINTDESDIEIELIEGKNIKTDVRWCFDNIIISDDILADDLNNYFSDEYVGSSHYISDDGYVFDNEGILRSVFLFVPSVNYFAKDELDTILCSDYVDLSIKILDPIKFNAISPCDYRYLSCEGDYLLCLSNVKLHGDIERIRIHNNVDFIFLNKKMIGFMMTNPLENIVFLDEFTINEVENRSIELSNSEKKIFILYFNLVDETGWDKINDGDLFMFNEIKEIQREITNENRKNTQLGSLYKQCDFIINNYYNI